ncbi:hypothetical protein JMUB7516_27520 [Staphylococcus aureus]
MQRFFKQKTAYEMQRSLVGSEMCIRDRGIAESVPFSGQQNSVAQTAVSYTHLTLPTILLV